MTSIPFHTTVQDALTILLDERSAPNERISRATELLSRLPMPNQAEQEETIQAVRAFEQELRDHGQVVTYTLGDDGQFHETLYQPEADERLLTEDEIETMRREGFNG